jgi:hypothetical protein
MWVRKFTVRGSWNFPLDMLRYDGCWPSRGEDVQAIYSSITGERGVQEVTLSTVTRTKQDALRFPTDDRWSSFNWKVVNKEHPYSF